MSLRPSTSRQPSGTPACPARRRIGTTTLLFLLLASVLHAYEEDRPPRFLEFKPPSKILVDRIEDYCRATPLSGFLVDSIDARLDPDNTGWARTWGRPGWSTPRRASFRFESGKVVQHRLDTLATDANDRKLSQLRSLLDSCRKWRDSMRLAEADSLAADYENFGDVTIGKTGLDSVDGLGLPMETRILQKGRIGVLVDKRHAPANVTLIDAWNGLVSARLVGHRESTEERCPSFNGVAGDSTTFPVAVYSPEKPVTEILVALRGRPALSGLKMFNDSAARASSGFRFIREGRYDNYPWADIWYGDDLIAKLEGDAYLGSTFSNTYAFQFRGRTIHGFKASIRRGEIYGWLFHTEYGWREVYRSNAVRNCYD